jgi:hypothetical protein
LNNRADRGVMARIPEPEITDPIIRRKRYEDRQRFRLARGPLIVGVFSKAYAIENDPARNRALNRIRNFAGILGASTALIEMLEEAGRDQNPLLTFEGATKQHINEFSDELRIPPEIRQSRVNAINLGRLITIIAYNRGESAGRVNLLPQGAREPAVLAEIGKTPMVDDLWINEYEMLKGIGTKLMEKIEEKAKSPPLHSQRMALGVSPNNDVARYMYEKLGYTYHKVGRQNTYRPIEEFPDKNPPRAMLMVKELK